MSETRAMSFFPTSGVSHGYASQALIPVSHGLATARAAYDEAF